MKKVFIVCGLFVLFASFPAFADSLVRVQCEDEDAGAEVFLNGKFVGECPMDAPVGEGIVQLLARKVVNGDFEKVFEKKLKVVDGVAQRVEIVLSAPRLTAEATLRKEAEEVNRQLRAAQEGDVDAMNKMAQRYEAGIGVKKDPAAAVIWRNKAEAATAQEQLRAAKSGDIKAMDNMAERYDTGEGVDKDPSEAQLWRKRAQSARLEQTKREEAAAAVQRSRENEAKAESISYFKNTSELVKTNTGDGPFRALISSVPATGLGLISDLFSAPSVTSQKSNLRNAAALRPSTWGKPDSLIARTAPPAPEQHSGVGGTLLLAEAK